MDKHQKSLFDTTPEPWEVDASQDRLIVTIALPEAPFGPFDYTVPEGLRELAETGRRARVPLGRGNRSVVGYIVRVSGVNSPRPDLAHHRLKDILSVVDSEQIGRASCRERV